MYQRDFEYKVYTPAGVYIKTINPNEVLSEFEVTSMVNGGQGSLTLRLNRPFDNYNTDGIAVYNNVLKVYEHWKTEGATTWTTTLIYTGYLTARDPHLGDDGEYVGLTFLGVVSKLNNDLWRTGTDSSYDYTSNTDPSAIVEDIIDNYRASVSYPLVSYTAGTLESTGTVIKAPFTNYMHLEAIVRVSEFLPSTWYFYVDEAGLFQLHAKAVTATHTFTIGKDVLAIDTHETTEGLENYFILWNGKESSDPLYLRKLYYDQDSIDDYETHARTPGTDGRITIEATLDAEGNKVTALGKDPAVRTTIEIAANYDITSIKPGQTCRIRNHNATNPTGYTDTMQIVRVKRSGDKALLDLAYIHADVTKLWSQPLSERVASLEDNLNVINGAQIVDGSLLAAHIGSVSLLGWQLTNTFTSTTYRKVSWTSGSLFLSNGVEYALDAGDTGNMTAATVYYIYLDTAVSLTVLQKTTSAVAAAGANRIIVASAIPVADTAKKANFYVFGGRGGAGVTITADNIVAASITGNEIAANSIVAGNISVTSLSAIQANLGSVTISSTDGMDILTGGDIEFFGTTTDSSKIVFNSGVPASKTAQCTILLAYESGVYNFAIDATNNFEISAGQHIFLWAGVAAIPSSTYYIQCLSHVIPYENAEESLGKPSNDWLDIYVRSIKTTGVDLNLYADTGMNIVSHRSILPAADNTHTLGNDTYEWKEVWSTDTSINSSDRRLKESVEDSRLGIDFIRELRPRSWKWRDTEVEHFERLHYGMIAQEVEETLQNLGISTNDFAGLVISKNGKYYLRYAEFIAPLIAAVKDIDERLLTIERQSQID